MLFHFVSCFVVIVIFVFDFALSQDYTVKECLSGRKEDESHKVALSCPPGTAISVGEAFFGRNDWGACSLTLDDCTEKVKLFTSCQWKRNCTVFFSGIFIPTCGTYATVLRVYYDCVDESTIPVSEEDLEQDEEAIEGDGGSIRERVGNRGGYLQDPTITSTDDDDVALIAGCATAVVITTIVLIIAIVLVVRRLVGSNAESVQDKHQGCLSLFICTKLGCATFVKQRPPQSTVAEASPPIDPEVGDVERRVAPIGADSAEEVFESDRQNTTADGTQPTSAPDQTNHPVVQTNVSVTIENEEQIVAQNTEINSRSSYAEESSHVMDVTASQARTEESSGIQEQQRSSSGLRMDAIAVPNTELSTLC